MLYSFLPNKEMATYTKLFTMILDHVPPPLSMNCDFEKAIHDAASKVFILYMVAFSTCVRIGGEGLVLNK